MMNETALLNIQILNLRQLMKKKISCTNLKMF